MPVNRERGCIRHGIWTERGISAERVGRLRRILWAGCVMPIFERAYAFGSVSPARESDIPALARDMREIDVIEIRKFAGIGPVEALQISLKGAKLAYCLRELDGTPVSIIGVGWLPNPRAGVAWFLSSDKIDKIGLLFLQETRAALDDFMLGHDVISNYIYSRNEKTIKWLKWMGFEILSEITTPYSDGELFYEMARFRDATTRDLYVNRDWNRFARVSGFSYADELVDREDAPAATG